MKWHYRLARRLGYELLRPKKAQHLTVERHLVALLNYLDINCVLDVGANVGQYATALRSAGFKGRIVSFEPIESCFHTLSEQADKDDHWHCYNYALGAQQEEKRLNIAQSSKFSSFHQPLDESLEIFSKNQTVDQQMVAVQVLDDVWPSVFSGLNSPRVFLKMDTQGYDVEVFKGVQHHIDQVLAMQSEISVLPIYHDMPDYLKALAIYRQAGFELTGMYPVSRDPNTQVVVEFDCVMARTDHYS